MPLFLFRCRSILREKDVVDGVRESVRERERNGMRDGERERNGVRDGERQIDERRERIRERGEVSNREMEREME